MSWKYQVLQHAEEAYSLECATDCPDYLRTVQRAVEYALNEEWEEGLIDVTFDHEKVYVAIWRDDVFQGVFEATAQLNCPDWIDIKLAETPKESA